MAKKKSPTPKKKAQSRSKKATRPAERSKPTDLPVSDSPLAIRNVRISKDIHIPGYVIDQNGLTRIQSAAYRAIAPDSACECTTRITAERSDGGSRLEFDSTDAFLEQVDVGRIEVKSIGFTFSADSRAQLEIFFESTGTIEVSGFSSRPDFQHQVDQVEKEVKACDQHYHVVPRTLSQSRFPRRLIRQLILICSLFLFVNVVYYFYATSVGVDVESSFLSEGNEYFRDVEKVLKNGDDTEKLNVLLRGQLRGFTNVTVVLHRTRT